MTATATDQFSIGWDVGAWNCDRNPKSRDAIVILDREGNLLGSPWRGNLRKTIEEAANASDWFQRLFRLCEARPPDEGATVTLAIDAPLGFPSGFRGLIGGEALTRVADESGQNAYLFRVTERVLFERNLRPLSAVKDMIGSQATKAMHAVAKFAPRREGCGVWRADPDYAMIETYPSACRASSAIAMLLARQPGSLGDSDRNDARACAAVAWLFTNRRRSLIPPPAGVPTEEGWIWLPQSL